jgi:hypothetical protein
MGQDVRKINFFSKKCQSFWDFQLIFCLLFSGTILLANSYALVASLISTSSIVFEFPELLLMARLIAASAASVGLISLICFLQQIPSASQRALFTLLCPLSISCIECFALCLHWAWPGFGERLFWLLCLAIPPQFVGIWVMLKMRETPQFLLLKYEGTENCREKPAEALRFYRGENG